MSCTVHCCEYTNTGETLIYLHINGQPEAACDIWPLPAVAFLITPEGPILIRHKGVGRQPPILNKLAARSLVSSHRWRLRRKK